MNPSVGCSGTIEKGKGKSALAGNGKGCFKRTKREYLAQFRRQRNTISTPSKAAFRGEDSSESSYRFALRVMASLGAEAKCTHTEEVSEATTYRPDEKMGSSTSEAQGCTSLEMREERVRIMEEILRLLEEGKLVCL